MGKKLINAAAVREKIGGCSDMHLWRLLNNADLQFPRPSYINSRRYWLESEIDAWIDLQAARAA